MREKYKYDDNKTVEENIALALYAIVNSLEKINEKLYEIALHKNPTSHENYTEYSYAAAQPKATGEEVISRSRSF